MLPKTPIPPKKPRKRIDSLNHRAKIASEGFSFLFLGKSILLSIFLGYFVLYRAFGFPAGLSILLVSFPLFSLLLSRHLASVKIRQISGFSPAEEFHRLFVALEKESLFSHTALFLSASLSLSLAHQFFPSFLSGYSDVFPIQVTVSSLLFLSVIFLGTFIVPSFARYSLSGKLDYSGAEELEDALQFVERKTRALSLFPAVYFLIVLLFLLDSDRTAIIAFISLSTALLLSALLSFYLDSELLTRKRKAKEGVLPAKDEQIIALFFGLTPIGNFPNFRTPFSEEHENSLMLTNRRLVFLKIPSNGKKTAPEIERAGREIAKKGLPELLRKGLFSLEYFEIGIATIRDSGLELDISAKDGRTFRYLLLDREHVGRLRAHLKTRLSGRFV